MDTQVIFSLPDAISKRDKAKMFRSGFLVIEVSDFSKVKTTQNIESISGNDLLSIALTALDWGNDPTCRHAFADLLRKKIIKNMNSEQKVKECDATKDDSKENAGYQ